MIRLAKWGSFSIAMAALVTLSGAAEACPTGRVCSPGKACPPESNCVVPGNPLGQPGTSADHLGLSADPRSTTTVGDTTVGDPQNGAKPPESELERIKRMPDGLLKSALLRRLQFEARKRVGQLRDQLREELEWEARRAVDLSELERLVNRKKALEEGKPIEPLTELERTFRLLVVLDDIDRVRAKLGLKENELRDAKEIADAASQARQAVTKLEIRLGQAVTEQEAIGSALRAADAALGAPVPGERGLPPNIDEVIK